MSGSSNFVVVIAVAARVNISDGLPVFFSFEILLLQQRRRAMCVETDNEKSKGKPGKKSKHQTSQILIHVSYCWCAWRACQSQLEGIDNYARVRAPMRPFLNAAEAGRCAISHLQLSEERPYFLPAYFHSPHGLGRAGVVVGKIAKGIIALNAYCMSGGVAEMLQKTTLRVVGIYLCMDWSSRAIKWKFEYRCKTFDENGIQVLLSCLALSCGRALHVLCPLHL